MARYIDADRTKTELLENAVRIYDTQNMSTEDVMYIIDEQPTADVAEVKHGKWIIKTDEYDCEYMMCSVCKEEFYPVDADTVDTTPNYCPNCGAKMDLKEGETK